MPMGRGICIALIRVCGAFYVTKVTFARPGPWAIEIIAGEGNGFDTARVKVTVLDSPPTPMLGSTCTTDQNLVASDVRDLRQIDTSERPDRRLHRVRIADAITQGKPQVIVFATPQFCTSQMCGPMLEIVRRLLPVYARPRRFHSSGNLARFRR